MIVYYNPSDGNAIVAVYSHPTTSRAWDAFTMAAMPGALTPGVDMHHHKVSITPNPNYPDSDPAREHLYAIVVMTQAEKDAHPLAQPDQPSPTPTEIEVPRWPRPSQSSFRIAIAPITWR